MSRLFLLFCICFNLSSLAMFGPQRFLRFTIHRIRHGIPTRSYATHPQGTRLWSDWDNGYSVQKDKDGNFLLIRNLQTFEIARFKTQDIHSDVIGIVNKETVQKVKERVLNNIDETTLLDSRIWPGVAQAIDADREMVQKYLRKIHKEFRIGASEYND